MTLTDAIPGMISVGDADFRRYQQMMLEEAGINLSDAKRGLLAGRLARRLRELEMSSYGTYFDRVSKDSAERVRMFDLLLTNETGFFREPAQFDFISGRLVPQFLDEAQRGLRRRSLRIWSAGCSTGEEPYSLAMLLHNGLEGWRIEIEATDLSTRALQQAQRAIWPITAAAKIPEDLLRRYMLRGVGDQAGMMTGDRTLRTMVHFRRANLNDGKDDPAGPFDLVLCRNVLIYFEAQARRRAMERLVASCAPDGHLFLGHAETLHGFPGMRTVQATIWRRIR